MRFSRSYIPTLRETPNDPDSPGRRLLRRAGYLRNSADWLPLGQRSLLRIEAIAARELEASGGQAMRAAGDDALGQLAREIRSYKQLPQTWYRSRRAVEGSRFALEAGPLTEVARRILLACGVRATDASPALAVVSDAGESQLLRCACGYAAPFDLARSTASAAGFEDPAGDLTPEPFHTPGQKTIADIAAFTGLPEPAQMKSLVLVARDRPVLVMVRGDHQMSAANSRRSRATRLFGRRGRRRFSSGSGRRRDRWDRWG